MNFEVVDRSAEGKWYSILSMLGIDAAYLVKKHGPCPICQGKDRFRYDDQGRGMYYCNGCGAGNGYQMLEKFHNWDFKKAVAAVAAVVNCASESVPQSRGGNPRAALRKILKECSKDRLKVVEYLQSRGLSVFPSTLRQHPGLPYYGDGRVTGTYPAMLATVYSPASEALSVHRTYLSADLNGSKKKMMSPVKPIKGGAIRLFREEETLAIGEGIETCIAVYELLQMKGTPTPVWSVISTAGMESFQPPKIAKRIIIFADNDVSMAGQKSAYVLANRLVTRNKLEIRVNVPPKPGTDWLDYLNEHKRKRA